MSPTTVISGIIGFFLLMLPVMPIVWVIQATGFWVIVPIIALIFSLMPAPQSWTDANDRATEARKARDERR
mgnify:CR=1 FL=1